MSSDIIIVSVFGIVFISAILLLAIRFPHPTAFQVLVFRVVLALAAGGIAAVTPGFFGLETDIPGLTIRAGGALAVFVFVYRFNPANLLPLETTDDNATVEKELIVDILGNTYRRAFSLNFTTRFVNFDEYKKVMKSIQDCHGLLQGKMVQVAVVCRKETTDLLAKMLKQLEVMETVFRTMEPYAREPSGLFDEPDKTADFLPGRVDGSGQPGLMRSFVAMEEVRMEFLLNTAKLADKYGIPLPDVPITEARPVFHGAATNLEYPTVQDIERSLNSLRVDGRYGYKPHEIKITA